MVNFGWYSFTPRELPATATQYVAGLGSRGVDGQTDAAHGVLTAAGVDWELFTEASFTADEDLLDVLGEVLEAHSPRPWESTVRLAVVTVRQWSTIRGRLIDKGVPDPLRMIPSMNALLDVVEVMLMESCEDDDAREKLRRELYPPRVGAPPPGDWSDDALLEAFPEA